MDFLKGKDRSRSIAEFQAIYGERRSSVVSNYTSDESKEQGDILFHNATKKRLAFQGCRIFNLCSRDKSDMERLNAVKMYAQAAHHFMNSGQWDKAGESYENCARLQELGSGVDTVNAASSYNNSAICYKQHELMMQREQQLHNTAGDTRDGSAAVGNVRRTSRCVSLAMEGTSLPSIDDHKLEVIDTSLSRLAHMQMHSKQYQKAAVNFENLAHRLCRNNTCDRHVDDFFFKAAMCNLLCTDDLEIILEKVEGYLEKRDGLRNTKEFQLWKSLLECVQYNDTERFTAIVEENRKAKIWLQNLLADISVMKNFGGDIKNQILEQTRRQCLKGFRHDPFYSLYN